MQLHKGLQGKYEYGHGSKCPGLTRWRQDINTR